MTAPPISAIDMVNILRAKIGEEEAKALTEYVTAEVINRFEGQKDILATKDDLYKLSEKMSDQFKWMVGLFIPLYLSMIGLIITLLLRH